MRLSEFVPESQIRAPLTARTKRGAIDELLETLAPNDVSTRVALRDAVYEREAQLTTGIGRGVAVPHGYTHHIDGHICAVGVAPEPIEFASIDGKPVTILFLFACNPRDTAAHVALLSQIARLLNDPDQRAQLEAARSPAEVRAVFLAAEKAAAADDAPAR